MKHLAPVLFFLFLTQTLPAQSLEEFIGSYARDHLFSGTILVRENGQVHYYKSMGLANRPGDIMENRSMLVYLPDRNLSVIMLTNTDETDLDEFVRQIIDKQCEENISGL